MFTPDTPSPASSSASSATSAGRSLNPASMSTVIRQGRWRNFLASARVSARVALAPSGSPAAAATPRLVVPTAGNPRATNAAAEAWSHAFGSNSGRLPWCRSWKSIPPTVRPRHVGGHRYDRTMANPHLDVPPVTAGADLAGAEHAALVVHGRGQTPAYMLGILDRIDLPGVACLLPHAANDTWYPAGFMQPFDVNQPWLG